jgi:DHA3 family macrolide efflux protein-like MFS transporter
VVAVIWGGQAFSIVTSYAASYAAIWHITDTTGSALWLSIAALVSVLPTGLLNPFGGVLADRFNRRSIMLVSDAAVAAASAGLGIVIWQGHTGLDVLLGVLAIRAVAQAFRAPAMMAAMPLLVPERHLVRVNSLNQLVWGAAGIGAPALGILLYETVGLQSVMFLDAGGATMACLGLLLASIPTVRDQSMDARRPLANLVDGFRVIRSQPGLYRLMALCVGAMVMFMPAGSLFPLLTKQHFGGDGYHAALTESVFGVGVLVGVLILFAWGGGRRHVLLVVGSGLVIALTLAGSGALPPGGVWAFLALCGVMGFACGFFNGPLTTVIQRHSPQEKMGRVMGLFSAAINVATPVGLALGGFAAERTGVALWFVICGLAMAVFALAPLAMPSVLALDRPVPPAPDEAPAP